MELGTDATFTSATRWIEREPSAADPTQISLNPNPLGSYTVVNARVGFEPIKDRLEVLSVAGLLGEAIHRIHHNESVSALFKEDGKKRDGAG